ncbi:MAG: hypothetical protein RIC16_09170 [Rhodospirillales bacterium]
MGGGFDRVDERDVVRDIEDWDDMTALILNGIEFQRAHLLRNSSRKGPYGLFRYGTAGCMIFGGNYETASFRNVHATRSYYIGWYCLEGDPSLADVEEFALRDLPKLALRKRGDYPL